MSPRSAPVLLGALAFAFLLFLGGVQPSGAASPLGGPSAAAGEGAAAPSLWQRTLIAVNRMQGRLQRDLSRTARAVKQAETPWPFFTLAFIAFLYGVFHAAGPGHGKIVISSYLLAHESKVKRGVQLAFLSSLAQAVSAIALVGVFAILFDLSRLETTARVRWLEIASYGLIIAIGMWMLALALRGKGCSHDHGHAHAHEAGGHAHEAPPDDGRRRSPFGHLAAIVLAVGIRPCSGAVILLLFALAQGIFAAGVGATFVMAIGTAITVSALALFTVMSRRAAVRIARSDSTWERRIQTGLAVTGSLAVSLFGVILLFAALDQTRPI